MKQADVYLIRPTRYDDAGYPLQWWRSIIPSNSLATVSGLVRDAVAREVLGPGVGVRIHEIDESNDFIAPEQIVRRARAGLSRQIVFLVGVQTNQYPRAMDLARRLRAGGIPVCIGGFHVSGCLGTLKEMTPELREAQELGVSLFAGEAEEGRLDEVLRDAWGPGLKPLYQYLDQAPALGGQPLPFLERSTTGRLAAPFSCFDLGRGCPYLCSFCAIINVQGNKSRFRTPDDLEAIVRRDLSTGVYSFFITDDNFSRNQQWEPLLDRLIELRRKGLEFRLVIQTDTMAHRRRNFIAKCAEAGVAVTFVGMESINPDHLQSVGKRQNHVDEYKELFLSWKAHHILISAGFIIGFPGDTRESVLRDIDTIKRELPIDLLSISILTPIPGSMDYQRAREAGIWMDPDLNKYNFTYAVTRHPTMSVKELDDLYREVQERFFSWEHALTIMRRTAAFHSQRRASIVNALTEYLVTMKYENCSMIEGGIGRIRRRTERRPGLAREHPLLFYPKAIFLGVRGVVATVWLARRLRLMADRIFEDPRCAEYRDAALIPPAPTSVQAPAQVQTRQQPQAATQAR